MRRPAWTPRRDVMMLLTGMGLLSIISDIIPSVEASYVRKRTASADEFGEFGRELDSFKGHAEAIGIQSNRRPKATSTHKVHRSPPSMNGFEKETMEILGRALASDELVDIVLSLSMSMYTPSATPAPTKAPVYTIAPTPASGPPTTASPVTNAPATAQPTTSSPVLTGAPTTASPVTTNAPVTAQPATSSPVLTGAPTTASPVTNAPATPQPTTSSPVLTGAPTTASPVTTNAPATPQPTLAPTPSPVTAAPTAAPVIITTSPTLSPTTAAPFYTPAPVAPVTLAPSVTPSALPGGPRQVTVLTLQEEAGVCTGGTRGVGCASDQPDNPGGNPNDIVNCFDVQNFDVTTPFQLQSVRFWLGDSSDPPTDLELRVWEGTVNGGPSSNLLYSQTLVPGSYSIGENNAGITTNLMIAQQEFCVGVASTAEDEGLRLQTVSGTVDNASYLRAPGCDVPTFTVLPDVGVMGDFCIEALVLSAAR